MNLRRASRALVVAACVTALAGLTLTGSASGATGKGASTTGGTLNFVHQVDPRSLDPVSISTASQSAGIDMFFNAFGALVFVDSENGNVVTPLLAKSLTSPDNGITWVLKLKPNVKFSDGTALDAAAVVTNWDRIKDPANASAGIGNLANVESYTATDPLTVTIKLKAQNAFFPNTIATSALTYIASPTAIQQKGADFGNNPVGAGPFLLKEWVRGDHSTWTPNSSYLNAKKVKLSQVVVRPIADTTQKQNAFATNAANLVWTGSNVDVTAMTQAGGQPNAFTVVGGLSLVYNMKVAPFTDPTVRTAFVQAMNRSPIAQGVWAQTEPLQKGLLPVTSPYLDGKVAYAKQDLKTAQKAIDAYTAKNGPIQISLLYTSGNQQILDTATTFKQQLEQLNGVSVTLESVDQSAVVGRWRTGQWTMTFSGLSTGVTADPVLYNTFHSKGSFNFWGYSNPTVDSALDHSRTTTDPKEQQADYDTVQQQVVKDAFYPPFNAINYYLVGAKNVKVVGYGDGTPRTDLITVGKAKG